MNSEIVSVFAGVLMFVIGGFIFLDDESVILASVLIGGGVFIAASGPLLVAFFTK